MRPFDRRGKHLRYRLEVRTLGSKAGLWVERWVERHPVLWALRALILGLRLHRAGIAASAMAFDLFLALLPMLALAGWLITVVLRSSAEALVVASTLLDVTPREVSELALRHFGRFSGGAVAPVALLVSLFLASVAFHTLIDVFETASGAEPRSWVEKRLIALGCVLAAILLLGLSGSIAVLLIGGPARILETLLGPLELPGLARHLPMLVGVVMATASLAGLFRVAGRRPGVRRRVWPGAVLAVSVGAAVSYGFAYYLGTLGRYALYYGGLAAVAVVLVWLYLVCWALLAGAELNLELENGELTPPR
jgi:membrane protein